MYYQQSPGDNKTGGGYNGQQQQETMMTHQYASFTYQQQQLVSTPLQFQHNQQQQHSPTKCIKNSVVNRQMMKHQRSPYYSKEHLHHLAKSRHNETQPSNYFSNLSSPSGGSSTSSNNNSGSSRYLLDSGLQMSYSTSSPDITRAYNSQHLHLMPPPYETNLNGSSSSVLSESSSSSFSSSNMLCNPPTTPVSMSSSNNSHTSSETPPMATTTTKTTVFQQSSRQEILSIPSSSSASSVSGREQQKLYVTPATTTSPSLNSESKSSTGAFASMANTCSGSLKSSLDSSFADDLKQSNGGSGCVSSGSYSGIATPGSYSDLPDSPSQIRSQYQPPMPPVIPSHCMNVPGFFQSPGGHLYAWQQPLNCSTLRFKPPQPQQQSNGQPQQQQQQLEDVSYTTTVDSSCSKSNDITIMERTLQMGNLSSNSNSQQQQQASQHAASLSHQNSWSFQTALSSQSANTTNQFIAENTNDNDNLKHHGDEDDDQSDTKSVYSNFSGFSVISDIARDQAQYTSVDSDAIDNMISFCRQRSANNSAMPTPILNRQQAPVMTSSANKSQPAPPWSIHHASAAPVMGSSIRSIFLSQDVNHTPPSKDVETNMPWRTQNPYMNSNRALSFGQNENNDHHQDRDVLRTYDQDNDVDDSKSIAYSIPSIIQNEQESIKSRPPIDLDSLLRGGGGAKQGAYNPIYESSNSLNWTMLNNSHASPHCQRSTNNNDDSGVPASFLPPPPLPAKTDMMMDESMNNQSTSLVENSTLDDEDDEQMNQFIEQNFYDESSDEDDEEESDIEDYDDCGPRVFESMPSTTTSVRVLLPKIEEVQEEEDYSPKPTTIKKSVRKNQPPVIQMNKTALLRVNKMKEMAAAAASKSDTAQGGVKRTTSIGQNLNGVKENKTTGSKTTSHKATGSNKINPIRRMVETSNQQQQVLTTSTNLHSSKFNKY